MKSSQLQKLLAFCIVNGFPVLVKGAPGIGKTDTIETATEEAGADLILSHPVVSDPTDFKGLPFAAKGKADFLPYGDLRRMTEATKPTVFFLDDLGQASPAVQAACMQLILARQVNGHKVPDCVTFIAATNRKEDKAAVSGILEPVKSRFVSIVELEVDTNDWIKWALTKGNMPIELISFIRFRPELLHTFLPTKDIINSSSPRTVASIGKLQNAGLPSELQFETFKGAAGEAFATEYKAFLDIFNSLPNIEQIFLAPDKVEVPTGPAVLYAISGAIAARITEVNSGNAFKYLKRLPAENGAACVKDIVTRKPELTNTRGYAEWASDNGNAIFQ